MTTANNPLTRYNVQRDVLQNGTPPWFASGQQGNCLLELCGGEALSNIFLPKAYIGMSYAASQILQTAGACSKCPSWVNMQSVSTLSSLVHCHNLMYKFLCIVTEYSRNSVHGHSGFIGHIDTHFPDIFRSQSFGYEISILSQSSRALLPVQVLQIWT